MITAYRDTMTETPGTGVVTRSRSSITGSAIELSSGEGQAYASLGLIIGDAPLLLFTPTTYGDAVRVGDLVGWPTSATVHTVRHVRHLRPDGVVIASYCILAR